MNILSGLFKSRDRPKNATSGSAFRFYLGSSTAGKNVSERSAMQMTAVYACVRVLSEAVAGLPLHQYKYTDKGSKEKAIDRPLYFLLHDEPNPEMCSFVFRETMMTHLLLWGNAYAQIIRNGKGEVMSIYPLMPSRMTVDRNERGELYYQYQLSRDDAQTMKGSSVILKPSDVLHIPGLGFDGLVGYSPIAMAKNAIGLSIATEEYGSKFFANGATPGGVLEHPGTLKNPARVRESWNQAFGGSANSSRTCVLEEGMHYTPITIAPDQAQFLETRKFQLNEIARIFRVPPHMIGDLERATFSNIEHLSLEFVKYSLDPWLVRWEQSMSRVLFTDDEKREYFIKFNVDGLLRGDYQSRMSGYSVGIQNGFLSPNDVRELENMDLIPDELGGNRYLCNGNMIDIGSARRNYVESQENTDNNEMVIQTMKNKKFWNWVKNDFGESDVADTPTTRTLYLNGVIAEEPWYGDEVTPQLFKDELASDTGDIEVWINSIGGDVWAATQIYNMLKSYKGKVTIKIDSLAASVIAMAGDEVLMSPLSLLMVHNPLTIAAGDVSDMQKAIDMLDEVKESIINAYELKSGLSRAKISHMMDCETWLSAKKAVELGFADSIMFSDNDTNTDDSYEFSQREVSNRLMNHLIKKNTPTAGVKISDLQTRLNLLK